MATNNGYNFPDYSGIFKPGSGFDPSNKNIFGKEFNPWSSENTGPSGPDFSKSSDDRFGETFKKWGQAADLSNKWRNRDNNSGFSSGGFSGGGVQGYGDYLVVQSPQQAPYTIEGRQGFGGALGTLAGIGASFIPGLGPGIAAAMPAIGGSAGSFFG